MTKLQYLTREQQNNEGAQFSSQDFHFKCKLIPLSWATTLSSPRCGSWCLFIYLRNISKTFFLFAAGKSSLLPLCLCTHFRPPIWYPNSFSSTVTLNMSLFLWRRLCILNFQRVIILIIRCVDLVLVDHTESSGQNNYTLSTREPVSSGGGVVGLEFVLLLFVAVPNAELVSHISHNHSLFRRWWE